MKFIKQKKRNLLYLLLARVNIHTSPLHLRSRHSRERLTRIFVRYLDDPIEQKISTNDQMSLGRFFPPFHQSAFKSPAHLRISDRCSLRKDETGEPGPRPDVALVTTRTRYTARCAFYTYGTPRNGIPMSSLIKLNCTREI